LKNHAIFIYDMVKSWRYIRDTILTEIMCEYYFE
jgi:hypothetical protein